MVRVRCHLPVQVKHKSTVLNGWVLDMGHQGLRLRLDTRLPKGTCFTMRAILGGHARVPFVNFKVLWSRPQDDKKAALHGVGYDEGEADLRRSWVWLLFRELGLHDKHTTSRRKYLRVDGRIPVRLLPGPQLPNPPEIEMINVGVGGLLIRSRQALIVGQLGQITLGPWQGLKEVGPYEVDVINVKPDESSALYCQAALRFVAVDNQLLQKVGRYVVQLLRT